MYSFDLTLTIPHITTHRRSPFPPIPSSFIYTPPPTLISSSPSPKEVFTRYNHSIPYAGYALHLASAIQPSHDRNDPSYRLSSAWYLDQDGNTDWQRGRIQAVLPPSSAYVHVSCVYTSKQGEVEGVKGEWVEQGRKEYGLAECRLPNWSGHIVTVRQQRRWGSMGRRREVEKVDVQVRIWVDVGPTGDGVVEEHLEWRNRPVDLPLDIPRAAEHPTWVLLAQHHISTSNWTQPKPRGTLGIALSPIALKPSDSRTDQLRSFIEWRVWHRFQGVQSVHWQFRDNTMLNWVEELSNLLGLDDTATITPILYPTLPYADQLLYNVAAGLRHGRGHDWLAFIDYDEYILPRHDSRTFGTLHRLAAVPEEVVGVNVEHTYWAGPASPHALRSDVQVEAFPAFPRNGYTKWDNLETAKGFRQVKPLLRMRGLEAMWIHGPTRWGAGYGGRVDKPDRAPDGLSNATGEQKAGKGLVQQQTRQEGSEVWSELELLHARDKLPPGMDFERDVGLSAGEWVGWEGMWRDMAEVLRLEGLEALYDRRWTAAV